MAYRRCLLQRGSNLIDRRIHPSFTYVLHGDEGKCDKPDENPSSPGISNIFIQTRSFGSSLSGSMGFSSGFRHRQVYPFAGYNFCRNMSTMDQNSDKITEITDVADVLTDTVVETVTSQAPVVSEVAIAAADSYLPVQALQYVIDAVHSYTGLNWWLAIALSHFTLNQLLNNAKTIAHLKQTHAIFLKLLTPKPPRGFYDRLLLRVLHFSDEKSNLYYALKLFDTMPNCSNCFLWTSLIRAFLSHHTHFRDSISTYAKMHRNGIFPSEFTFSSVLNACGRVPALVEGKQVHARVMQSGFIGNNIVQTALLDMYAKSGWVCDARDVFDGMVERDVVAWTAMICGYAKVGKMVDARLLFDIMGERSSFTWTTMVAGYTNCGDMKAAKELYDVMSGKDVVMQVAMIAGYGKLGNVSEAKRIFDGISVPQDPSICAAMLACYAQNGYAKDAIEMYEKLRQAKIKITEVAMVGAISACAQLRDIRMSNSLMCHIVKGFCEWTHIVSNALIYMHSKCGNIDLAWREFSVMSYRDLYTHSSMIAAFAEHGKSQDAVDLFLEMQQEGLKPNQVTFIGVLNACSASGLIEQGCRFFQIMTEFYGIEPLPQHYTCMVDLLGRAGQLEKAYSLIKENSASADATTWGSLLAACRVYGNMELGETAARHLFEIDPTDSGNYVLLANTYAANDKWERAEEVKKLISKNGMKKPSGYSWIQREIKGQYQEEANCSLVSAS